MRNYLIVEKDDVGDIFLSAGKGTEPDDYDVSKHWEDWEYMANEDALFKRIKELLKL